MMGKPLKHCRKEGRTIFFVITYFRFEKLCRLCNIKKNFNAKCHTIYGRKETMYFFQSAEKGFDSSRMLVYFFKIFYVACHTKLIMYDRIISNDGIKLINLPFMRYSFSSSLI